MTRLDQEPPVLIFIFVFTICSNVTEALEGVKPQGNGAREVRLPSPSEQGHSAGPQTADGGTSRFGEPIQP